MRAIDFEYPVAQVIDAGEQQFGFRYRREKPLDVWLDRVQYQHRSRTVSASISVSPIGVGTENFSFSIIFQVLFIQVNPRRERRGAAADAYIDIVLPYSRIQDVV